MRNDKWLEDIMYDLWENHFEDVPRLNNVVIKFGKRAKRQLGAISWADKKTKKIEKILSLLGKADFERESLINITAYFKDEKIPEYVVRATIAHELCHYTHGFNSPLKRMYKHPHKGGVVTKELNSRGLGSLNKKSKKWLKANWPKYIKSISR